MNSQTKIKQKTITNQLFDAIKEKDIKTVKLLAPYADLLNKKDDRKSHIQYAAGLEHWDIVYYLLDMHEALLKQNNIKTHHLYLDVVLVYCVRSKKLSKSDKRHLVERLINHGAKFDERIHYFFKNDMKHFMPIFYSKFAALHHATVQEDNDMIEMLLKAGVDVNQKSKYAITALQIAVAKGNHAIVNTLLKAGAKVNEKNQENTTALHIAAARGDKKCIEILLDAGAAINAKNKHKQIPIDLALENNHRNCVKLLLEFHENRRLSFLVLALNLLFSENQNNLFNIMPLEIRLQILQVLPGRHPLRSILNKKNKLGENITLNNINDTLALHRAHCAVTAYNNRNSFTLFSDKINSEKSAIENTANLFTAIQSNLDDSNKNKHLKAKTQRQLLTQFSKNNPGIHCNGVTILEQFHCLKMV